MIPHRANHLLPPSFRCFVVVHLDTTRTPPTFKGAHTYSEHARSLTGAIGGRSFAFDVAEGEGPTYEEARANALRELLSPHLRWVRLELSIADRAAVSQLERQQKRSKL